jgi:hypothetical protein
MLLVADVVRFDKVSIDFYKKSITLFSMNFIEDQKARNRLAYQVGSLEGFIKYGVKVLSCVEIKDQAAFDAAIAVAIKRIEEEAEKYA